MNTLLAKGTWALLSCPRCASTALRTEPLLVTRMDAAAPVILALADEQQDSKGAIERLRPMLLQVQHSFGEARYSTRSPIIPASFSMLARCSRLLVEVAAIVPPIPQGFETWLAATGLPNL